MHQLLLALALLPLSLLSAQGQQVSSQSALGSHSPRDAQPYNFPPIIVCDFDTESVRPGAVKFEVRATDPEGDLVNLRVVNPIPGMRFQPQLNKPSPATSMACFFSNPGPRVLVFEASDSAYPKRRVRHEVRFVVQERTESHLADVNGDGLIDFISSAQGADVGGAMNAGAVYVWFGSTQPSAAPDLTLTVPGSVAEDYMSTSWYLTPYELTDVTGDGQIDIIANAPSASIGGVDDVGAIYVWAGGPNITNLSEPTATLTVPGATAADRFSENTVVLDTDVTGDGLPDLIAYSTRVDVGSTVDNGGCYVFAGGPTLVGQVAPTASLLYTDPDFRQFRISKWEDVSGDGIADLLFIGIPDSPSQLSGQAPAIFMWTGGSSLAGTVGPDIILPAPVTTVFDNNSQSLRLAEVTGDGMTDVLLVRSFGSPIGAPQTGVTYLWRGGPTLATQQAPTAELFDSTGTSGDYLGRDGVAFADLNDDGTLDIVIPGRNVHNQGVSSSGIVAVFQGGPSLVGQVDITHRLGLSTPALSDFLSGSIFHLADFNGDSIMDVLASSTRDLNVGALHVWSGGPGLSSLSTPETWPMPSLSSAYRMGTNSIVDDLNQDGILDIAIDIGDSFSTGPGGATGFWFGTESLAHDTPDAVGLVPGAMSGDSSQTIMFSADVTGDKRPDIVLGRHRKNEGTLIDTGAIYVWDESQLSGDTAPSATLVDTGGVTRDELGKTILFNDINGDGVLDILAPLPLANIGDAVYAGKLFLWPGGPSLIGTPAPAAELTVPGAVSGDRIVTFAEVLDWNNDGALDVLTGSPTVDVGGIIDTGAHYFWDGTNLTGSSPPDVSLTVPGATEFDRLGG